MNGIKGVVLLSGGMDSAVLAAHAMKEVDEVSLLHVNYGQRTEAKELSCFHALSDEYEIPWERRLVVDISHLAAIGGSALTDRSIAVPAADLSHQAIPVTYVPFRNAHLVCIAVSWAEVIRARHIYIAAVETDSSGYPDCRPSFYKAMNDAIREGTKPGSGIAVKAPFVSWPKNEIVTRGRELGVPFEKTWSCYQAEDVACGVCDSCVLRYRAFAQAGVVDPIPYAVVPRVL